MRAIAKREMLQNNLPRGTRAFPPPHFHLSELGSDVYFPPRGLRCNDVIDLENKTNMFNVFSRMALRKT